MSVTSWFLIYCLLGQAGTGEDTTDPPANVGRSKYNPQTIKPGDVDADSDADKQSTENPDEFPPPGDTKLSKVPDTKPKLRPPELLAEALSAPKEREGALIGRAIKLRDVLSRVTDRQQQIKAVQSYWKLAAAQADYHFARDQRNRFTEFTKPHTALAPVRSVRAADRAAVLDAELAVQRAQHELADQIGTRGDEPLPLASDRPHVGGYRTSYETVVSGHVNNPRLQLIHRTLPLKRKAIDAHADAILGALDALEASGDAFQKKADELTTLIAALDQLARQRHAFIATIREYNQDIAEYALSVAPLGAAESTLLSMLITVKPQPADEPAAADKSKLPNKRPSSRSQPAAEPGPENDLRGDPEDSAPERTQPGGRPIKRSDRSPDPETRNKPVSSPGVAAVAGLYQGLVEIETGRTQKLAGLLHWDRDLLPEAGQPTSLADCLRRRPEADRRAVIAAYWRARERVARYQAIAGVMEQFDLLSPAAVQQRAIDRDGVDMLRLQAAKLAAKATLLDEHAAVLETQFDLTRAVAVAPDADWIFPSTPPHGGSYRLQPAQGASSREPHRLQQLGSLVKTAFDELDERSDAIVFADAHRAALSGNGALGQDAAAENGAGENANSADIGEAVTAVQRQIFETLTFLHAITDYNLAIADYALALLPPDASSDKLVSMLVIPHAE